MKVMKHLTLILPLTLILLLAVSPALINEYDGDALLPRVLTSTDYSLCLASGALLSLGLMAWQQRKGQIRTWAFALIAVPLALICGRLGFCLARFGFFFHSDKWREIFSLTQGGYLLYGAVFGAVAASALYSKLSKVPRMQVLDAAAVPGLLLIAFARFAEFFSAEGRGDYVDEGFFPLVINDAWGYGQLAVFVWEGVIALLLMLAVIKTCKEGKGAFMLALVLYACCQVVLESLREDSCPRFGFVRVNQVLSAAIVLCVTAWRAFHTLAKGKAWLRTLLCVAFLAVIGIMEWGLDKLNISNWILYGIMILFSALMAFNCLKLKPAPAKV